MLSTVTKQTSMSNIQNIRTQGTSGVNSGSDSSRDNLASDDTRNQNNGIFSALTDLRNRMTEQSSIASSTGGQAEAEAKTSSPIKAVTQLVKEMIEKAQTALGGKGKSVEAPSEGPQTETGDPNSFLFNQKNDTVNIQS